MYETFARNKVLTPRPLEGAPEMRIFGMKEASKGLLQFLRKLRWDLRVTKQVPKRREKGGRAEGERKAWGIEDLDQEEEEEEE